MPTLYRNGKPYLGLQGDTDHAELLARMRRMFPAVRWSIK